LPRDSESHGDWRLTLGALAGLDIRVWRLRHCDRCNASPPRSGLRGRVRFHSGEISPRQFVRRRIVRAGFPNRCKRRVIRRVGSLLDASAPWLRS